MDSKVADKEGDIKKTKKKPEKWKLPKVPVDQVYRQKPLRMFPSYAIKDLEKTITLDSTASLTSLDLIDNSFISSFKKKKHEFLHLGLVQVAVKPLMRSGLEAPVLVCLRDVRHPDLKDSLLALVESNLSHGPSYFNCFPSFSVSFKDVYDRGVLSLYVKRNGAPIALTYRIVCKAMVDLNSEALHEATVGKTTFFHANSKTPSSTIWDEVQIPKEWDDQGRSMDPKPADQEGEDMKTKRKAENWKLPKIPVNKIYKNKLLRLFPSYAIIDVERIIPLDSSVSSVSIDLLDQITVLRFKKKENKFLHWGLVQVAIQPLTRGGLEAPILVCLRDDRFCNFEESLLALVESNLSKGPFYLNCFPGYSIYIDDARNSQVLNLCVKTNSVPLAVTYRVVCKVMEDPDCKALGKLTLGKTTYAEANSGTLKTTIWNEVQVPKEWMADTSAHE